MGNCINPSSRVDNAQSIQNTTNPSRVTSKVSLTSIASTLTNSEKSLPAPKTEIGLLWLSNLNVFTFNDLRTSTRNFRPDSLLGEGGFGFVYKGWIDEHTFAPSKPGSGMVIAVKKLKPDGHQGHKEWLAEINYLGQLHHPNLVKLIGCCSEGDNRLLVYEFMPKGSLENHLFRSTRGSEPLPWLTRIKVAIGAARGLSFLHEAESQVIYRDFKASNILLDSDFNAKLSDFGLAKAGPTGDKTHVSTQIVGTHGYAAPEYLATGRLSAKADVYSFGVVLLELLSGLRAYGSSRGRLEQNLVDWMRPCLGDKRRLYRVIDPRLGGMYPKKGAHALADLALKCLNGDGKLRPRMSEVIATLEEINDAKPSQDQQRERERALLFANVPRGRHRQSTQAY